jgi:ABC-2 type transport system permease protein
MFLVSTVIADAFAGERERHTLETLLATRLSDNAILFGKIAAAIGYAGAMTIASQLLAGVTVNLATRPNGLVFYTPRMLLTMGALGAGGSLFVGAIGVLISLRAATVRQAQQALSGTIVVLLLMPLVTVRLLPAEWKRSVIANAPATWQLAVIGVGALLVLDIGAVALAMHRFTRSRLIACVAVLLLWSVPSMAQAPTSISPATRDSLLDCASHLAASAGFTAAPGATAGRLGLMRTRTTPAGTLVDGMRVVLASKDSTGATPLDVRVSTFLSLRTDPFSHQEMSPPKALTVLADSIRMACRPRR